MIMHNQDIMAIGNSKNLPLYRVICFSPSDFYVVVDEDGGSDEKFSEWVKGKPHLYHKLNKLFKKDKPAFIELIRKVFNEHPKHD